MGRTCGSVPRRRIRPAVQRLDAHAAHQGDDPVPPDGDAFVAQEIPQHPAGGSDAMQGRVLALTWLRSSDNFCSGLATKSGA